MKNCSTKQQTLTIGEKLAVHPERWPVLLLAGAMLVTTAPRLHAQAKTYWASSPVEYDTNNQCVNTSIAISGSSVVEMHDSNAVFGSYYRTGTLYPQRQPFPGGIVWNIWWGPVNYRNWGQQPAVALSRSTVIEEDADYQHNGTYAFQTRTGQLSNGAITWNAPITYDGGFEPALAVSGSTVVEVHQAANLDSSGASGLYWRTGTLTSTGVNWNKSQYYDYGWRPRIAIVGNIIVEVHAANQDRNVQGSSLWYRTGQLQSNNTIVWNSSVFNSYGDDPALTAWGNNIVEIYHGPIPFIDNDPGHIYWRSGVLSNQTVTWGDLPHGTFGRLGSAYGGLASIAAMNNILVANFCAIWDGSGAPLYFNLGQF